MTHRQCLTMLLAATLLAFGSVALADKDKDKGGGDDPDRGRSLERDMPRDRGRDDDPGESTGAAPMEWIARPPGEAEPDEDRRDDAGQYRRWRGQRNDAAADGGASDEPGERQRAWAREQQRQKFRERLPERRQQQSGGPAVSQDAAVGIVRGRTGGRVLRSARRDANGVVYYEVRVLTPDGRVRDYRVDAATGQLR
jgi:uncharacterized membrane protein YkoI